MLGNLLQQVAADWPYMLLIAAVAYLLGSLNFAILVTRAFSKRDIRDVGSGNAGMTNVLRSQGKWPAVLTTLGDIGKSVIAVLFGGWLIRRAGGADAASAVQVATVGRYIAGLFCELGHMFPLYFGFRGGKGVLVTFGMLLVMDWRVALLGLAVFLIVVACSRMVSLGSLCAAASIVVLTGLFDRFVYAWDGGITLFCTGIVAVMAALVFARHAGNIKRICNHTERKLSFGKNKEE